jgi:hypothetical protein
MEELSKMSVMELNTKMSTGQLPIELKGMTILELVEHMAGHMKRKEQESEEESSGAQSAQVDLELNVESDIKSSFSDNFLGAEAAAAPANGSDRGSVVPKDSLLHARVASQNSQTDSMSPGPPTAFSQREFDFPYTNADGIGNHNRTTSGFDDDFSNPVSSPAPAASETATTPGEAHLVSSDSQLTNCHPEDESAEASLRQLVGGENVRNSASRQTSGGSGSVDRYAVLREFQMEEELIRAWKSPTEEEKEVKEAEEENSVEKEDVELVTRDYYEQRVCSSEGSPRSRSRSDDDEDEEEEEEEEESRKSGSEEEEREESKKSEDEVSDAERGCGDMDDDDEDAAGSKRDGQIPLVTDMGPSRNGSVKSNATGGGFDDNFDSTFGPAKNESVSNKAGGWATFDVEDNQQPPSLQILSEQGSAQNSPRLPPTTSHQSPAPQQQQQFWANSIGDSRVRQLSRRRSSSASKDSLAEGGENPFINDAFTPPPLQVGRQNSSRDSVPVTPLVYEGRAYSAQSSNNDIDTNGDVVADTLNDFESACFRVHAKVFDEDESGESSIVPKSDSINIFAVKKDPFDDDFFK